MEFAIMKIDWLRDKIRGVMVSAKRHSACDGFAHGVGVESVGNSEAAVAPDVVGEEFLDVHDRGVVFSGEPASAFAAVDEAFAEVAGVSAWCVASGAVIYEQAVGVEGLSEGYGSELVVGGHGDGECRAVKCPGVDDTE